MMVWYKNHYFDGIITLFTLNDPKISYWISYNKMQFLYKHKDSKWRNIRHNLFNKLPNM